MKVVCNFDSAQCAIPKSKQTCFLHCEMQWKDGYTSSIKEVLSNVFASKDTDITMILTALWGTG